MIIGIGISIILLFLLLIVLIIYYKPRKIQLLNKEKLSKILITDPDNFYKNLTIPNLKLRKITNRKEYLQNIEKYLYTLNKNEECIVLNAICKAQNILFNNFSNTNRYQFDYNKMKNIPWIIGCSKGDGYEFGLPHTRNNIIILNYTNIYDKDLYKTLIHERVHIYQKLFPENVQQFLQYYNFQIIGGKNIYHLNNPDTDDNIYYHGDIVFESLIINDKVTYPLEEFKFEHPFEFMAYLIVKSIDKE